MTILIYAALYVLVGVIATFGLLLLAEAGESPADVTTRKTTHKDVLILFALWPLWGALVVIYLGVGIVILMINMLTDKN